MYTTRAREGQHPGKKAPPQTGGGLVGLLYGEELANGSWAGVVGMLQRREADITVNDFSITQSRSEVSGRGWGGGMKNLGLCGVCVFSIYSASCTLSVYR